MSQERFRDRVEAGQLLGRAVAERVSDRSNLMVLALPRGGVPVGYEVARALAIPMDVFIVRKLGVPGHEELAMGAIASGGIRVMNDEVLRYVPVSKKAIEAVSARELTELARRERSYRGTKPPLDVRGKTVIVVDDGLATGSTMRAAVRALRQENAGAIIVAVPVAARETCEVLLREVDDVVCLRSPDPFQAVGLWYDDFSQTTDEEVHRLLAV
ncbi:MAG TPA: phosphoribosyltransferase [Thermoanaerobaculia bacterium]|nr:phosphoribosyltransferase [Thermoanaerobaculia bacterium]